ncbi:MAG: MFS transporter [Hyphomicrobiales bacterium]
MIFFRNLFWGWYVVGGAFLLMAIGYGARYSFGIFVQPLTADNGWSRSVVSLAASINLLVYAAAGIGSGKLLDRVAPRWIVTAGTVVSAIGFLVCAIAKTPWVFCLAYGVLYGFGSSWMGTVTVTSSVGKWFNRKRGLAIGISSMGVSFGTLTLTPVVAYILEHFSWQAGFLFLGANLLIPGLLIGQLLMRRTVPEAYGLKTDGDGPVEGQRVAAFGPASPPVPVSAKDIRNDSRFWMLALCHGTAVMVALMAFVHQVPYAIDNGIPKVAAATSLGAMGFAGLVGQFFFGWASDRIGDPKYSAALGYTFMAVGMVLVLQTRTVEMLLVYAVVFGFGYGCLGPLLPIIAADRFGHQVMGTVFGLQTFFVVGLGGSLGPLVGGLIYDATGSYRPAWWLNLGLLVVATAGIATLKRRRPSNA